MAHKTRGAHIAFRRLSLSHSRCVCDMQFVLVCFIFRVVRCNHCAPRQRWYRQQHHDDQPHQHKKHFAAAPETRFNVRRTHTQPPKKEGKIAAGFLFLSSLYFLRLRDRDNPADQWKINLKKRGGEGALAAPMHVRGVCILYHGMRPITYPLSD